MLRRGGTPRTLRTMKYLHLAIGLIGIGTVACADTKAEQQDFDNICNAPEKSGANAEKMPAEKATLIAKWLPQNIKTARAKDFMASLANAPPMGKGQQLKDAAKAAGYTGPCPMAE